MKRQKQKAYDKELNEYKQQLDLKFGMADPCAVCLSITHKSDMFKPDCYHDTTCMSCFKKIKVETKFTCPICRKETKVHPDSPSNTPTSPSYSPTSPSYEPMSPLFTLHLP